MTVLHNAPQTEDIILHWVRSLVGNEIADKSANEGHHINRTVLYKLTREECLAASVTSRKLFWNSGIFNGKKLLL